jgi:hypothetical protein
MIIDQDLSVRMKSRLEEEVSGFRAIVRSRMGDIRMGRFSSTASPALLASWKRYKAAARQAPQIVARRGYTGGPSSASYVAEFVAWPSYVGHSGYAAYAAARRHLQKVLRCRHL